MCLGIEQCESLPLKKMCGNLVVSWPCGPCAVASKFFLTQSCSTILHSLLNKLAIAPGSWVNVVASFGTMEAARLVLALKGLLVQKLAEACMLEYSICKFGAGNLLVT
ncbi:unnamed protein product [Ostreobium quekettii]|uniref:Uncharacterized protein n=1 Tax=Ostreobium quekettii TaxID=121088 RepID=A0A8S1IV82_9CHLO|nr:unnamed protein product [Ostreobium quekettii]